MNILSIDPHLRHMDCAIVAEDETVEWIATASVDSKGAQLANIVESWHIWARDFTCDGCEFGMVYVEIPDHIKGKGSNKQVVDLISVALCVGSVTAGFVNNGYKVNLVQPREWKGRKSKAQTDLELRAIVGPKIKEWTEHQKDAADLGLSVMRAIKAKKITG